MSSGERKKLAGEIARCKIDLKVVIEHGTPDERKRFIRSYIGSIEVDGKDRKIRVGYYDPGEEELCTQRDSNPPSLLGTGNRASARFSSDTKPNGGGPDTSGQQR